MSPEQEIGPNVSAPEIKTVFITYKATKDHGVWQYSCPQKLWLKEISDDNFFQISPEAEKKLPPVKKSGFFVSINSNNGQDKEIVITPGSVNRKNSDRAFGGVWVIDDNGEFKGYCAENLKNPLPLPMRSEQAAIVTTSGEQRVLFLFSTNDLKKDHQKSIIVSRVARP